MNPSGGFILQMRRRSTALGIAATALCLLLGAVAPVSAAPLRHLTFPKASVKIRLAAQTIDHEPVAIVVADRLGPLQIRANVEWEARGPKGEEECEALFFARLTPADKVAVRHGPIECRALFRP
jgi:hypothetical protein